VSSGLRILNNINLSPHFELIEPEWCKHVYAVSAHLEANGNLPSPRPHSPRNKKYPRDWHAYNEAKSNEFSKFQHLLYELCRGLPKHEVGKKGGRPRLPLSDLVYAAVSKLYLRQQIRQHSDHMKVAHEAGFISQIPKPSTLLNFFSDPDTAEILKGLIGTAAETLNDVEQGVFAADATTFSLPRFKRVFKYDQMKAIETRATIKADLICGVKTNVIAAVTVTRQHESQSFPKLLHDTTKRFRVFEVSADTAYASVENFKAVQEVGATPFIPFQPTATGYSGGFFEEMLHFYRLRKKEFYERYNLRNNAESTHSMLERRFTDRLVSKTDEAAENEILCMVLAHNICCVIMSIYCLGLDPEFWEEKASM